MGGMEKTTVYLTPEQKTALARAARAGGLSEASLIREGIAAVIGRHAAAEVPAALAPPSPSSPSTTAPTPSTAGQTRFTLRHC